MLDTDLARLYQVEVKALNQAVKRNRARFPGDFMFQLTGLEAAALSTPVPNYGNNSPERGARIARRETRE